MSYRNSTVKEALRLAGLGFQLSGCQTATDPEISKSCLQEYMLRSQLESPETSKAAVVDSVPLTFQDLPEIWS